MSEYIEAFCDNFHKYKAKNDLNSISIEMKLKLVFSGLAKKI